MALTCAAIWTAYLLWARRRLKVSHTRMLAESAVMAAVHVSMFCHCYVVVVVSGVCMAVASGARINTQIVLLQVYRDHVTNSTVYY